MQKINKIKVNPTIIMVFLLVFFLSDSTVIFGTNSNNFFIRFPQFFLIISCFVFATLSDITIPVSSFLIFILMNLLNFLTMVLTGDFQLNYIFISVLLTCSFLFAHSITLERFIEAYDVCLFFFCICSLIISLLTKIIPTFVQSLPQIINLSNLTFYTGVVANVSSDFVLYGYRNYGIFREPGVFQFYICLGILFQIYHKKRLSHAKIVIYIICILTTLSTTGYIALVLMILLFFLKKDSCNLTKKIYGCLAFSISFFYLIVFSGFMEKGGMGYAIFSKFQGVENFFTDTHNLNSSLVIRFGSLLLNIYLFLLHPFLGNGLAGIYTQYPIISFDFFSLVLKYPTDTLFLHFARYGIFFGGFFAYGFYKLSSSFSNQACEKFIITVFFLIELVTENYTNNILINILMWYGILQIDKRIYQKKIRKRGRPQCM